MAKPDRMPRVQLATPDDLQEVCDRLEVIRGELAAVAELMRQRKHKQLQITGWGKYDRALELLKQFVAHSEFALKTVPD